MPSRSLLIFVLLGASALYGQRYNFKFYGEEEGLQSLAVQIVLQDRAGFLWVGTQNGLFRYDGNRFAGFGKADGLPDAHIESLHESIDGTLWVGTRFGLARRSQDRFEKVPLGATVGIVGREGIASDSAGNLYIATEHGLVAGTPSPKGLQFRLVSGTQPATSVYVDAKGRVWFGCSNGLCTLDQGQAHDTGTELGLPAQRWDAILGDLEGNLWVRSEKCLYERSVGGRFLARAGLPESSNSTPTLALDPAGQLLAPTYKGLARQTDTGWEVVSAKDGLTSNDISTVIQDREGSIWIGLLGSGLARWLGYNEWQNWGEAEGLSRESTWSILRDATGRLWVGSLFGLNYAENNGGKLVWRQQPLPGVDGFIRTMAEAPDGTVWIGTDPNGLLAMNRKTGTLKKIGEAQGLKNTRLRHVAVDHEGRIWAATYRGLFRSTGGDGARFEQVSPVGTDPAEMFHMTLADREGRIWVAGDRGLVRYSGDRWRRFTKQDGLAYDKVAQVIEDTDGSLWVGYRDAYGITHLTFPGGTSPGGDAVKMESYTQANGLRSDKTLFLQFDARGWLWVGTDHGIDVFDRVRWRHYGRSDGLIWDDCNSNAFFADSDGGVWVGTSRGLSRFRPTDTPAPNVPPPVVLTQVKLGGKTADPSHSLEMPYQENSLQVRFAALTFVRESSVLFRYRLNGGTEDWLETTERELNYPKLLPGQYTLEVVARNAQGLWSAEPARLSFQVLTPWWLTWWFRLGTVVFALILGRLMWARRTHRLEAERYRLEKAVTDRTRELSKEKQRVVEEKVRAEQQNREIERLLKEAQQASRLKSEFLANVSHEIRTPMNGILGMTDLVLTTPLTDEQRDYLDTARLSAHSLLTILNDVLDFSKIEAGRMDLNPIDFSVRQCIRETSKMLRVGAAKKGLVVECEVAEDVPDNVVGDPDRLRQVLYNIIGNAIKFTAQGGVYLSVSNEPSMDAGIMLRFTVTDTGIGIPQEKQQLIFEPFRQADGSTTRKYGGTGLGLAISSSLVEMMGGSIRVKSATGAGSTFSFNARFALAPVASGAQPVDSVSLKNMLDAAGSAPGSLRILLAEDNPVNQRLAMRLLERRGHRVELASSGREAIEWLERKSFDLILMDLQMPDMDGLEATALIREREKRGGQRTPIVALTAHTMKGDRERCLEAGMDNYIHKPIDAVKFLEIVEMSAAPRV